MPIRKRKRHPKKASFPKISSLKRRILISSQQFLASKAKPEKGDFVMVYNGVKYFIGQLRAHGIVLLTHEWNGKKKEFYYTGMEKRKSFTIPECLSPLVLWEKSQ